MIYTVKGSGRLTVMSEAVPEPGIVAENVNNLLCNQYLAYDESIGGNAGTGHLAMNACMGPKGRIDGFGNYLFKDGHTGEGHRRIAFMVSVGGIAAAASSQHEIVGIYQESPSGEATLANLQATRGVANKVLRGDSPAFVSAAFVERTVGELSLTGL